MRREVLKKSAGRMLAFCKEYTEDSPENSLPTSRDTVQPHKLLLAGFPACESLAIDEP
jgi:uncharacterized OsmC-like protein